MTRKRGTMRRSGSRARGASRAAERKAPKTYRLAAAKIAAARKALGAPSDTAAIEMALDMVTFRDELVSGLVAMRGARIAPFDE